MNRQARRAGLAIARTTRNEWHPFELVQLEGRDAYVYDDGTSLGSTILGNKHVCPPEWWVWVPESGEEIARDVVRLAHEELELEALRGRR